MRKPENRKFNFVDEVILKLHNYPFLNYLNELLETNKPYADYDLNDEFEDTFTVPGRMEITLDDHTAYIDMPSDILVAIYKLVYIRTMQLEDKFEEGETDVDLQKYEC